ncbi:MAG TPA: glutaredoxin domain-containing protein [Polyangiaceae bacterium]|nr:glutaredoxin domain-containing protein [Polyangiaceae bacterium]
MAVAFRRARDGVPGRVAFVTRLLIAMLAFLALTACRSSSEKTEGSKPASAAPRSNELPPLSVKADTPNLLLTWIDPQGDFHVVQKPSEVPTEARKQVRVVAVDKEAGTGELVYVADLNETAPDGSYRLKTFTRAQWDELGASRRKARLEALAPSAVPPPATSAPSGPGATKGGASNLVAVIYGASWCKPCHQAADYLKGRGVTVIQKDIEESEAAQAEMRQKLARAGRGGASIPVIDVMGQILIGYSPSALDRAIQAAQGAKPL